MDVYWFEGYCYFVFVIVEFVMVYDFELMFEIGVYVYFVLFEFVSLFLFCECGFVGDVFDEVVLVYLVCWKLEFFE